MNERARKLLKTTLNQCFCDFGQKEFTSRDLLVMAENDETELAHCLTEWQQRGYLQLVQPLASASSNDACVRLVAPIERSPY